MSKILMLALALVLLAGCVVVPLGYPGYGYGYRGGYGYGGYGPGGYGQGHYYR